MLTRTLTRWSGEIDQLVYALYGPNENANGVSFLSPGLPSLRGYPGSSGPEMFSNLNGVASARDLP